MFVKFVIASIRSQYHFLVVQRSKKSPAHRKQVSAKGTPFPPNYSHCVRLLVSTGLYLYVNDFLITFASDGSLNQVEQVSHKLRKFSAMSGLQLNLGKSAYVTKGVLADPVLGYIAQ